MHRQDISRYEHQHVFHHSGGRTEKKTMRVVLLTVVMMIVEVVAGWVFNSMALFADGWHMSTHAAALTLSWGAFVLARRHIADRRFAFGTWKIEVLGGFVSGILLGLVGLVMAGISVLRLFHPAPIQFNQAIFVAVVGLAVNLLSLFLLSDRQHEHAGRHRDPRGHADNSIHKNLNLRAAYLHVVADAMTSVLAIGALVGGKLLHWNWLDPLMGIVGAGMIIRWTCLLLAETGGILLDRETHNELTSKIRSAIESDADARVSDLHVWKIGQDKYACIVAVVAAHPLPAEDYKARLRRYESLVHVTVETAGLTDPKET
ncbi:MAG: CDF family Co(II)/Ni(II) efflux transporter DmeF [Kiritimatiellia bacterium]